MRGGSSASEHIVSANSLILFPPMGGTLNKVSKSQVVLGDDQVTVGKYGLPTSPEHESLHTAGARLMLIA